MSIIDDHHTSSEFDMRCVADRERGNVVSVSLPIEDACVMMTALAFRYRRTMRRRALEASDAIQAERQMSRLRRCYEAAALAVRTARKHQPAETE